MTPALVVTCEHASHRVPQHLADLGLPASLLTSHRGYDPGALAISEVIAKALKAPLHVGRWSRLVADLNRSDHHATVVRRSVDGRRIPGNALSRAERAQRLAAYWQPYREEVTARIDALAKKVPVLHVAVHSFVERLNGVERRQEIGLLHDPERPREAELCRALKASLVAAGCTVRLNFPYFGSTDCLARYFRQRLPAGRYLGLEIEFNQRVVRHAAGERRMGAALRDALAAALR